MEVVVLEVLAMVSFLIGEAKRTLFENRINPVP
jgi:hypothetical protein